MTNATHCQYTHRTGMLELARKPPSDTTKVDVEDIGSVSRNLVADLTARGDMNVDSYRYEPAEMLMAMGEALRLLGASTFA